MGIRKRTRQPRGEAGERKIACADADLTLHFNTQTDAAQACDAY